MRRLFKVTLCVGAGLMIIVPRLPAQSSSVQSRANAATAGMDPERLAEIPVRMKGFVDQGAIAGAVMLAARHGVVASLEAVGYQDLAFFFYDQIFLQRKSSRLPNIPGSGTNFKGISASLGHP